MQMFLYNLPSCIRARLIEYSESQKSGSRAKAASKCDRAMAVSLRWLSHNCPI